MSRDEVMSFVESSAKSDVRYLRLSELIKQMQETNPCGAGMILDILGEQEDMTAFLEGRK